MLWVLESAYAYPREDIARALDTLTRLPILKLENETVIRDVCDDITNTRLGTADLLIGHLAHSQKCDYVLTFDKLASKHALFRLME